MILQIIDDSTGHTLAAVNTVQKAVKAEVGEDGNCSNKVGGKRCTLQDGRLSAHNLSGL